jgi:hypothetical protein
MALCRFDLYWSHSLTHGARGRPLNFQTLCLCISRLDTIEDHYRRKYKLGQGPLSFLSLLGTKEVKSEWTSEMLEVSVAGCAAAIFIPQFQSYKIRNSIADGKMTHGQMQD